MKVQISALVALAAVTVLCSPAEARRPPTSSAPTIDVAAIPPYPLDQVKAPRAGGRASARRAKASRTARRSSESRKASRRPPEGEGGGSGLVRSRKTGATARVSPRYAARFQAYVDDLEAHGAVIYYMGGYRRGRCSDGSQHPCGKALDVCQDSRGHVSGLRDCHLPGPARMAAIARAHDLYEGSVWCSTDYGHAQVTKTGSDCGARGWIGDGHRHYLASMTGSIRTASAERHHRHSHRRRVRYAASR